MSVWLFSDYDELDGIYVVNLGYEPDGAKANWGPGRRKDAIVHYVLSGEGFFNGHPVSAGQGFYIDPFQLEEYHADPRKPWSYVWFNCSEAFAEKFVKTTIQLDAHGGFSYEFSGKLLALYQKIFTGKTTMSNLEAMGYTMQILLMHTPLAERNDPVYLRHLKNAKTYIDNNLFRKLTVREVAEAVHINDRYLYNLFVQYEGIPVKEYILRRKTEAAGDLLENTSLPVKEIAAALGFHDLYTFSKFYKERTGVSPAIHRKSFRNRAVSATSGQTTDV